MRLGMYAWGGPGTIRIIQTKWHAPKIDEKSFLELYDEEFLKRAQKEYGLTDLWMTHSWGFSDEIEKEQDDFVRARLPAIRELGIKTYGYVQGFNVVSSCHTDKDFYATSAWGSRIPYSRGRDLICPLHPETRALLHARVDAALHAGFDAIFIDNIVFGAPPVYVSNNVISSFGCHCRECKRRFLERCGYQYPIRPEGPSEIRDVIRFRNDAVTETLSLLSQQVRARGREFGVNLYDPLNATPEIYFGYSSEHIEQLLDFRLIESLGLSLSGASVEHSYYAKEGDTKPTFVVQYRKGIGQDEMYDKNTIDAQLRDAREYGYSACLKASEYVTNGVWHAFDFDRLESMPLRVSGIVKRSGIEKKTLLDASVIARAVVRVLDRLAVPLARIVSEYTLVQNIFESSGMLTRTLRKNRVYDLPFSV